MFRQSAELAVAVPEVVAQRLTRAWLAGATPSARDRAELHRMWAEKVEAFYASWQAMSLEMIRASTTMALSPMWWAWGAGRIAGAGHRDAHVGTAALAVLAAGLAPVHRRAVANAKRLRRTAW
jgi:hypothetical protein